MSAPKSNGEDLFVPCVFHLTEVGIGDREENGFTQKRELDNASQGVMATRIRLFGEIYASGPAVEPLLADLCRREPRSQTGAMILAFAKPGSQDFRRIQGHLMNLLGRYRAYEESPDREGDSSEAE